VVYVEKQKEHHMDKTVIPILERTQGEGVKLIRETDEIYLINQSDWRRELETMEKPD
jgi:hypothetical protein